MAEIFKKVDKYTVSSQGQQRACIDNYLTIVKYRFSQNEV